MPAIALTPAQRKVHRAEAHHLNPVVIIGNGGLTPAVVKEAGRALSSHGLIKVKVLADDRAAREALMTELADRLDAAPIQHIGKLIVLWRPLPPKEKTARDERMPGPRTLKIVKFSKSGNHRATVKKVTVLGNERITRGGIVKRHKARTAGIKRRQSD